MRDRIDVVEPRLRAFRRELALRAREARVSRGVEWFLDNDRVVIDAAERVRADMPPGYQEQLPALDDGTPRAAGVAAGALAATEFLPEMPALVRFLQGYQRETPLSTGEVWALPTMLRLLALEQVTEGLGRLASGEPSPQTEGLDDDERVARAVRVLQIVDRIDWRELFQAVSVVERILRRDPCGAYAAMDFASRERYVRRVETLARDGRLAEARVARCVLVRARRAEGPRRRHVGWHLVGGGRDDLERELGARPARAERVRRLLVRRPAWTYLGSVAVLTVAISGAPLLWLAAREASATVLVLAALVGLLPASTLAIAIVQWVLTNTLPPRVLPRLDFERGIPPEHRMLVVVPTLLGSPADARDLVRRLELHYLASPDAALSFALLTDWLDAPREIVPGDEESLAAARDGVQRLNERYGTSGVGPFHLLHRRRLWNPAQGCWMGWERKRGKVEELNRMLLGEGETTYRHEVGDPAALSGVESVLTLDTDTQLPRGAAARLLGTLLHPLNRPEVDADGRVVEGYTILQPRLEVSPASAGLTRFTRIFGGDTAIDVYSLAVSDVYMDLFGTGAYVGKGLYDVAAFQRTLAGRAPENALLSHDHWEGCHGRVALVSDTVLYEEYPLHYLAWTRRLHRWVRGDWQLLPWLGRRAPGAGGARLRSSFDALGRWQLFDNLRRSLGPPALLLLLAAGWLVLPVPLLWTALAALAVGAAVLLGFLSSLAHTHRRAPLRRQLAEGGRSLREDGLRWLFALVFLPHEAAVTADAIARTLHRVLVTQRGMLEWRSAAATSRLVAARGGRAHAWWEMAVCPGAALVLGTAVALLRPEAMPAAAPLLLGWLVAPEAALALSRPPRRRRDHLAALDVEELRRLALRTWAFFETFVGPGDHWLPPDNYQEDPGGVVAHRTSPTNVGMALLSTLSAWDLGHLGSIDLVLRLQNTITTVAGLERFHGHLYNWYDTSDLGTLEPRYVSTVDSGNLAAALIVVKRGCREVEQSPVITAARWDGLTDALGLLRIAIERSGAEGAKGPAWRDLLHRLSDLDAEVAAAPRTGRLAVEHLVDLCERRCPEVDRALLVALEEHQRPIGVSELREIRRWMDHLHRHLKSMHRETELLVPWMALLVRPPALAALADPSTAFGRAWRDLVDGLERTPKLAEIPELCRQARRRLHEVERAMAELQADARRTTHAREWLEEMDRALSTAEVEAARLGDRLRGLAAQVGELEEAMDFRFLYDEDRHLFRIGHDASTNRPDPNHYDLLASEARLASFLAVARGQAPQQHWFRLGRPMTRIGRRGLLLSWGGTLFEYLMPRLVLHEGRGSLLARSESVAIERNIAYCGRLGVPWGVSESGFYRFDPGRNYQYRAFGVPGLGLRRGLADDLVVAPYASLLAVGTHGRAVIDNLARFERLGAVGEYGLYEAIDFTPERLPEGERRAVVRSYMAHHQGMVLIAIANRLLSDPMPRRFHAEAIVQSAQVLLHENPPPGLPPAVFELQAASPRPAPARVTLESWPAASNDMPALIALSNGHLTTLCTDGGGGGILWQGLAVTRFEPDATRDDRGVWIYLRDEESGELLSVSRRPAGAQAGESSALFHPAVVEYQRRAAGLFLRTEVVVVAGDDVEIRRISIANEEARPRRLSLTSYAEVTLAPPGDAARHPAFDRLFVRSELLEDMPGLLFERRPRSPEERRAAMVHRLVLDGEAGVFAGFETDRARFLGRGGSVERPQALAEREPRPGGSTGFTLDPILSLRAVIELPPSGSATVTFVTAVAASGREARAVAERYRSAEGVSWAIGTAHAEAARELERVGIDPRRMPVAASMLAGLVFPDPRLRAAAAALSANHLGQARLFGHGISGDLPILLVRAAEPERGGLLEECLRIHRLWHGRGVPFDLVVMSTRASSYEEDANLERLFAAVNAQAFRGRRGGIFVVRADRLPPEERALLEATARVILAEDGPPLEQRLKPDSRLLRELPEFVPTGAPEERRPLAIARPKDLRFDNGFGGFRADGRAYVIHLEPGEHTPAPWCNVLAHGAFGAVASESGLGVVWSRNAAEGRLVPWRNDPVGDEPAAVVWLRDEETGAAWSPTPHPTPGTGAYQVIHEAGLTRWRHGSESLEQELSAFVPPDEPVLVVRLRLRNALSTPRRITATFYAEWVLGARRAETAAYVVPSFDAEAGVLLARCDWNAERAGRTAFLASTLPVHGSTSDRLMFLGREGGLARPRALRRWGLTGHSEPGVDPCAALQVHLDLLPGGEAEVAFLLGEGSDRADALRRVAAYRADGWVAQAEERNARRWDAVLDRIVVHTPEPALDLLLNRWLPYQVLSSRVLGRTGFYQSSGAFGFRDQLQDVMGLSFLDPPTARAHLLAAAARQFEEGDVLHWWHPPDARGVRTRCSDDLAWLPFVLAHHVAATGDRALLTERAPFLHGDPLSAAERDRYDRFPTGEDGTLLEHARRALTRAWTAGEHGLPLIGTCDWNDGFDRVGDEGRGESVWLAWFLIASARAFAGLCELGEPGEARRWRERASELASVVEREAWGGAWYLRAFDDEARPLGADGAAACAIDSIAQSWAVLSGASDPERARRALASAEEHLVRRTDRLVLLFTPPFRDESSDPGYIRAYPPGARENGGQYTHAAAWLAWAFADLGQSAKALDLFLLLNPILAATTPTDARRYRVEPYVLAGDVASEPPNTGRGGWTWYTGSAAWMWRLGVERILGLVPDRGGLRLEPCIPPHWEGFEATVRFDGNECRIRVENPSREGAAVLGLEVDGQAQSGPFLSREVLATAREVVVSLGRSPALSS